MTIQDTSALSISSSREWLGSGFKSLLTVLILALLTGCSPVVRVGLKPFYDPVAPSGVTIHEDLAYVAGEEAHPDKHRLDLFVPEQESWPLLVFVHGGSFLKGDKDVVVGGYDIYGNIGRFYASQGIGVALVNYRLQPEVTWREQIEDVADAVVWLSEQAPLHGGDGRLFLAGHSAGAWLAARVAVDRELQEDKGFDTENLTGVVLLSGSGFELTDQRTWELYPREEWWADRFAVEPGLDWKEAASVVPLVEADSSLEFLILHSKRELRALRRQNRLLHEHLTETGIDSQLVALAGGSHRRTVLAMSHRNKLVSEHVLQFIRERSDAVP